MTLRMSDVHDLLREPGRVSVSREHLQSVLDELEIDRKLTRSFGDTIARLGRDLDRERKLAVEQMALAVRLRMERDEARKELVRERALHRIEIAEQVIDPTEYW